MSDYQLTLRRLTVHDTASVDEIWIDPPPSVAGRPDRCTRALVRLAALIASDGEQPSYQYAVEQALLDGASLDDVVGTLIAVTPVTGIERVVGAAPKIALALGYDIDAALERRDPD